jgi:tetratricopeptide (TPR) repeat protein
LKKQFGYHYIATVLITMALVGCSTQKNTFVNRNYHNLTAHYNVFFNGKEAMKAGLDKIETQVEEDYTKILPVYKESLPGTEKIVSSDMTTAIEKGTKLIKFHSMTKPPKKKKKSTSRNKVEVKPDYNNWADDAYMMMGRAYLYKKEYIMASSTFQLIIRKYKNEPVKYEAYLWYIRTLNESERYTEAQELIQMLEDDKLFPKKLEGELAIVSADLQLKQQHFDEAIHSLDIGIKKIKGNKRKSRYTFILAQLYQETGNKELALEAYHQVIRRRPEYSLLFNARIKSAEVLSGEGNISELRKELNKMRRKKWNKPYLDQIYYALANISYNEGKVDEAIGLYKKSVSVSKNNIHQRALSSLTLAEIYFDRKNYISSGTYYDSTMVIIDKNYPNFEAISKKYSNLNKLVENLKTVETQDSLLRLAGLNKAELEKLIAGWVDDAKKKQEASMSLGLEGGDLNSAYYRANSNRMRLSNSSSSFYFYNTSTVSFGKKEFGKLWGERKNEDDWRRKNKSVSNLDESGEPIESDSTKQLVAEITRIDDPTKSEYYMQDIPVTDTMKQVSNLKIRDALFNAGSILKTEFNDFEKSVWCFSDLNKRYPENIYLLSSYFNLWDLYKTIGKPDSSNYFKDLIVRNYPESNFAKYLVNPNFFIEEVARKDSMNKLYNLAYNYFKKGDFNNAGIYSKKVQTFNPDTSLISKVQFIRTISESKDLTANRFADSLRLYIKNFPKSEPTPLAEKIVSLIKEDKLSNYNQLVNAGYLNDVIRNSELLPKTFQTNLEETAAKWDPDNELLHYFIIAFPNDNKIDINRLKYDIANYNIDHYTTLDFEIETENLNADTKMIIVRNFSSKESAMIYFLSIIRKPEVFKALAGKSYLNFVASNNNYRQMLSDQTYNEYISYFIKNYSSQTTGKFSDKELESPEELMARMNTDPANELKEQGEYVVVGTKDAAFTPVKKEQLFNPDYNLSHTITIMINQKNAGTGYLMRDLIRYNSANYKEKRLKVIPGRMKESTLLSISSFPNGYEANEYLKTVSKNKELFASLGELKYELYCISDENLKKLVETENMEEWGKFYQTYYVRRTPPAPAKPEVISEVKIGENKKEADQPKSNIEIQKSESNNNRSTQPAEVTQKPITENAENISVPVDSFKLVNDSVSVAKKQEVKDSGSVVQKQEVKDSVTEVKKPEAKDSLSVVKKQEIKEQYTFDPISSHNLVYMLPAQSSNQSLLTTYLNRFNVIKYRGTGIEVVNEPFDDFRVMVIIKGFKDKEAVSAYFADVKTDQRISMSLRNINYKTYLISNENLKTLKTTKDIVGYQKFNDKNY